MSSDLDMVGPEALRFDRLRELVKRDPQISDRQRRDIVSAMNAFACWAEQPLQNLVAHPRFIRKQLQHLTPVGCGVSRKRFANVRCLLLTALCLAGISEKGSYWISPSEDWMKILLKIENSHECYRMTRCARYCTGKGIGPDRFDDRVSEQYLNSLLNSSLLSRPKYIHRETAIIWNRLSEEIDDWPKHKLSVPGYRDWTALPWEALAPTFKLDLDAYLERQTQIDPFDVHAPKRVLRPATIANYRRRTRFYLGVLKRCGLDPRQFHDVCAAMQPDLIEMALRFMVERNGGKVSAHAGNLALILAKLARDLGSLSEEELRRIDKFARNLSKPQYTGVSPRSRKRMIPFRDEKQIARLFLVPQELEAQLGKSDFNHRCDAFRMMLVVALTLLTYCPLRIGTLGALRLGHNLRWTGPNMTGALVLDIEPDLVKNKLAISFPLPDSAARVVRRYVCDAREHLGFPTSEFLFPSSDPNRPKNSGTLSTQLSRLIAKTTGLRVNVHLYRHIVHLVVLRKFPGAYAVVSRVLGHKQLETTVKNYASEDTALAMELYQALIAEKMGVAVGSNRDRNAAIAAALNGRMV